MLNYPDKIRIQGKTKIDKELILPGSKSLTNRAMVIASLADGISVLNNTLVAEDSYVMIRALQKLGIKIETDNQKIVVHGLSGEIPAKEAKLDLRLSGTSIRFLTALCATAEGEYLLDGNERMRERPIVDLLTALNGLGADTISLFDSGCPPVRVKASGLLGGQTVISGSSSSQYLSALLMVAPYAKKEVEIIVVDDLQSKPFIDMTLKVMSDFGVSVQRDGYKRFFIRPQKYTATEYLIETDAMAAGYFWAAAAITGGRVVTKGIGKNSEQGDKRLADVLAQMGCTVNWHEDYVELIGPTNGSLRAGTFDFNDMSDQAQTLAVVALFAKGKTRIENIWNLRIKETDRLRAIKQELSKFGAIVKEEKDAIEIEPLKDYNFKQIEIETYDDHRMAMAFALVGLRLDGVVIKNPECVAKTFPKFFELLAEL